MQIMKLEASLGRALFVRHTRRVALTAAGEMLLPYARRMLQVESEALLALASEEIDGRVVLGAPDDYMSFLLTPVLEHFSRMFARVEVELVCTQSTLLAPLLAKGGVDLAFVTRGAGLDGTFIRREPMIWVASERHRAWEKSPMPVALYEPGSVARAHTLEAMANSPKRYRATYGSSSQLGILAMVEAGLAVAAVTECGAPPYLRRLGLAEGLPPIAPLDIVLVKSGQKGSAAVDYLAAEIIANLGKEPVGA